MGIFCGASKSIITPKNKDKLVIYDDLFIHSLIVKKGKIGFLFLTFDLLGVDSEFVSKVKKEIFETYGIEGSNVLINAVHVHSSPEGFPQHMNNGILTDHLYRNKEYELFLIQKVLKIIQASFNSLEKVRLYVSKGVSKNLYGNRICKEDLYDNDLYVLRFVTKLGRTKAILINLACHPTVINDQSCITADLIGYMRDYLSIQLDGCFISVLNGAAGDISTRFNRKERSIKEAKRIGEKLAQQIIYILKKRSEEVFIDEIKRYDIFFSFQRRDDLKDMLEKKITDISTFIPISNKNESQELKEYLRLLERIKKPSISPYFRTIKMVCSVINFGDVQLIAIPGEIFSKTGMLLKSINKNKLTFIIGYAEDYQGYILPKDKHKDDIYENFVSLFPKEAEGILIKKLSDYLF
ncbi:hypothetical protein EV207_104168 [Scopulibacillus darangshiensis]|uniref:Neutral/alkaline ceramidase-like enzyme n=1 Tax=Scopulibacillus darangshiensis TaxID=442528 RepID=A0A4R2P7R1_9BACL|nr:hypothetical protein [Scopulibacillus darangshiensis]TCP30989.1 hypothetical protein EV207_104168 [Scopulibacillus darangshiensis]